MARNAGRAGNQRKLETPAENATKKSQTGSPGSTAKNDYESLSDLAQRLDAKTKRPKEKRNADQY